MFKETILAAGFALCQQFGISNEDCSATSVQQAALYSTNPKLWYTEFDSTPDGYKLENCNSPIQFDVYGIDDGSTGHTYACLLPDKGNLSNSDTTQLLEKISVLNKLSHRNSMQELQLQQLRDWINE